MTHAVRLACTILTLFFMVSASFAVPFVSLSAVVGPPTTKVTVTGTGFGAFAAVDIYFDSADLCLAIANDAGVASCPIRVPKDAQPQAHYITMLQRNTGTGAQAVFTVRTDWTQFHGRDAAHNGLNPFENTINAANVSNLDTLWAAPLGSSVASSTPVLSGGRVFLGGGNNQKLHAFNSESGTILPGYPKSLLGSAFFAPAIGNGNVYVATNAPDNKLYAFNLVTGTGVPSFPVSIGGSAAASPTVALNKVFIVSTPSVGNASLRAFNALTGAAIPGFTRLLQGTSAGSPTIANGVIYIGDSSGRFHSFDANSGSVIPNPLNPLGDIRGTAAISAGAVYIGSLDFKLYAFTKELDAAVPGFPVLTGQSIESSPAVGRGLVIVGSDDDKLYAFRTSTTGTPVWAAVLNGNVRGSPIISNDLVFVNTTSRLHAISIANGAILWTAPLHTTGTASPVVSDGIVYLSSFRSLYAFSVHGEPVSARLAGGALGIKPALSSLKPDYSLRPVLTPGN